MMSQESDRGYIEAIFPEILEIKDENLRAKVAQVWINLWKKSSFAKIEDVPFHQFALVEQIRAVANVCINAAKNLSKFLKIVINTDYLIALALLSNASYLLELDSKAPGKKTKLAELLPHPLITVEEARQVGLPDELVYMIYMHTFHPPHIFITPKYTEQVIYYGASLAVDDAVMFSSGKPTHLEMRRYFQF